MSEDDPEYEEALKRIEEAKRTQATALDLSFCNLKNLPSEIFQLTNLHTLYLGGNGLNDLPAEIARLTNLHTLNLSGNELNELPAELARLKGETVIYLYGNPFDGLPVHLREADTDEILDYLDGLAQGSERQWQSKLVVVGEGGAGKSCTLRSLRGEAFKALSTTHGMERDLLELTHPVDPEISLSLNTWDFAGQQIDHMTHQFFLTEGSLFLLVWNARQGFGQSNMRYWLETIQALAKDAPILIVATHTDERDADLPFHELQREFPQIKALCKISNRTGDGVPELLQSIARHSIDLPLMGEELPVKWLEIADAIRDWSRERKTCSKKEFLNKLAEHEAGAGDADSIINWLHKLGHVLYHTDKNLPELEDTVVLDAEWLSKRISKVMNSDEVIDGLGILTRATMDRVWCDEDQPIREHLLAMMEKFDLSYKTLDNKEVSLVVNRLTWQPPGYEDRWNGLQTADSVSMRFELATIPAGVPGWFIARAHRFSTGLHWRTGALFSDGAEDRHLALLRTDAEKKEINLCVRGVQPINFFAKLEDGLQLTFDRFQGLKIKRYVPCPGHPEEGIEHCPGEFEYDNLVKALKRKRNAVECAEEQLPVPLGKLLYGLHVSSAEAMLKDLAEVQRKLLAGQEDLRAGQHELLELAQRQFLSAYNREKDRDFGECPYVFTLSSVSGGKRSGRLMGERLQLHLYCQAPKCWHPVEKGGVYAIEDSADWLKRMAPYMSKLTGMMKTYIPLAATIGSAVLGPQSAIMAEASKLLPDIETETENILNQYRGEGLSQTEGAALRALREFLHKADKKKYWGGLRRYVSKEGHYYWLCDKHYAEMSKDDL